VYTDGINEFSEDDFEYYNNNQFIAERDGTMASVQKPLSIYTNRGINQEHFSKFIEPLVEHAENRYDFYL
jgi:hypothetical protein